MTEKSIGQRAEPILNQLAVLARADVAPEEFMRSFFGLIRAGLSSEGGSLWLYNRETRQLAPRIIALPADSPLKAVSDEFYNRLVYAAIERKSAVLYSPNGGAAGQDAPQGVSLVAVPVEVDDKTTAVVLLGRVLGEGGEGGEGVAGYAPGDVHALQSLSAYLVVYFTHSQLKLTASMSTRMAKFAEVQSELAAASEKNKMAFILANRTREMMFFDRVFVAFARGSRFDIAAVSGVDDVQQKGALVQNIRELVREFARIGGDWHFTPKYMESVEDAALRDKLVLYFETGDYNSLLLARVEDASGLLAVMGFERRAEESYSPADLQLLQSFCRVSARALRRADEFSRLPGIKTAKYLHGLKLKATGARRTVFFVKIAAALAVAAILAFGRMELTVRGDVKIVPHVSGFVAPRIRGVVKEVLKTENDMVTRGETIALLDDREMRSDIREKTAQRDSLQAEVAALESIDIAQWNIRRRALDLANAQLDGLRLRLEYVNVTSPQDGRIVTPRDQINDLRDAVVDAGRPIAEVADSSRVFASVEVAERDISLVRTGEQIEFTLAGEPGRVYRCRVDSISPATRSTLGKNSFEARGVLENADGVLRPGQSGRAGISTGKRALVYVIFRSTIDWVHSRFL